MVFGVTHAAVIKWICAGKIRAIEVYGCWRIPCSEVERLLRGEALRPRRVSGSTQGDDLDRQLHALREWARKVHRRGAPFVHKLHVHGGVLECHGRLHAVGPE